MLDALADFAKETGVSIRTIGDQTRIVGRSVSLDINARSFWEGLDQLCHQAGLAEVPFRSGPYRGQTLNPAELGHAEIARRMSEEMGILTNVRRSPTNDISLMAGDPADAPTFYAGAVRIRAVPTALFPRQRAAGPRIILEVMPQPHLPWRGVLEVRVGHAVDDVGQNLDAIAGFEISRTTSHAIREMPARRFQPLPVSGRARVPANRDRF